VGITAGSREVPGRERPVTIDDLNNNNNNNNNSVTLSASCSSAGQEISFILWELKVQ
jgi:hypothetical protein